MCSNMLGFILIALFYTVPCYSEKDDLGTSLVIGNAIDVFANYGSLSQVTQVLSTGYEDKKEPSESKVPFKELNLKVFVNVTSRETGSDEVIDMDVTPCTTFDDLLNAYFKSFQIEGTSKPWKAFIGVSIEESLMRIFGIEYTTKHNCCYVLVRLTKKQRSVELDSLQGVGVKDYVSRAIEKLNISDTSEVRRFMKSYGTHYIDSYVTGDFIYQVFKYKRRGYKMLRSYIRQCNNHNASLNDLPFYFSSHFLQQVGDIKIASGNETIETWAIDNLKDLPSKPSVIHLQYNSVLVKELNELLGDGALLGLRLKTLRPLFKDEHKADKYAEIVENDLQLWEVNI